MLPTVAIRLAGPAHELPYPLFVIILALMAGAIWYLARSGGSGASRARPLSRVGMTWRATSQTAMTIDDVDEMSGQDFEQFFAMLMQHRRYHEIEIVGGPGDGGADIIATDPDGTDVVFQCKRQSSNVGVAAVRSLLGTVSCEWQGLEPCLVTTAFLTKSAEELAQAAGVRVIDRPILAAMLREVYGWH